MMVSRGGTPRTREVAMSEGIRGERPDIGLVTTPRGNKLGGLTIDNTPAPLESNVFAKPGAKVAPSAVLGEDATPAPAPRKRASKAAAVVSRAVRGKRGAEEPAAE